MVCRNICENPEYKFIRHGQETFYNHGAKRCNAFCHCWLDYDGIWCPCCNMRLRCKPRLKTGKVTFDNIEKTRIG